MLNGFAQTNCPFPLVAHSKSGSQSLFVVHASLDAWTQGSSTGRVPGCILEGGALEHPMKNTSASSRDCFITSSTPEGSVKCTLKTHGEARFRPLCKRGQDLIRRLHH